MIKIGVPYWYGEHPFNKFVKKTIKQNIDFIEISLNYPHPDKIGDIETIKRKFNIDISFHSAWADISLCNPIDSIRKTSIEIIKNHINFSKKFNPLYFVFHQSTRLPTIKFDDIRDIIYKNAIKTTENLFEFGNNIALENMSFPLLFGSSTDMLFILNNENGNICLDIGHIAKYCARTRKNFKEEFDKWINIFKEKILVVHLHDFIPPEKDHVPIGTGKLDIEYIIKRIKETNCKYILLEYHHNFNFNTYGRDITKIRNMLNI
ncbi:MAG: sugar phosphate isomerase/epimerase [Candidatus Aenigmarchaeota archaeon]|nr:sugar phosphate isomerase/epimerase [Candidatus Aenigmarchaeota archaeon]